MSGPAPEESRTPGTLLSGRDIRELSAAAGIHPSKQRGQNFVTDPNTVRLIVARAGITADSTVLEIGPGLGSLTLGLLETGAEVVAVELDRGLADLLPATLAARGIAADRCRVVHQDALTLSELPAVGPSGRTPTVLVANLPYNVATPILLTLLERFEDLTEALVMVQSEVVDRLSAGPGSRTYGAPSAKAAWYGRVTRAGEVSRQVFWPVPNVDSSLVQIVRHAQPLGSTADRTATFAVIDAAFAQRRKTLRAALRSWAGGAERAGAILAAAGIDPSRRGETLTIHEFRAVGRAARALDPTPPSADQEDP